MKVVFSSFLVGLVTSFAVSYEIAEQLRNRRLLWKNIDKKSQEELDAIIYRKKLNDRINAHKDGSESEVRKSVRTAINDKLVPVIRSGVDKVFGVDVKELLESFTKK